MLASTFIGHQLQVNILVIFGIQSSLHFLLLHSQRAHPLSDLKLKHNKLRNIMASSSQKEATDTAAQKKELWVYERDLCALTVRVFKRLADLKQTQCDIRIKAKKVLSGSRTHIIRPLFSLQQANLNTSLTIRWQLTLFYFHLLPLRSCFGGADLPPVSTSHFLCYLGKLCNPTLDQYCSHLSANIITTVLNDSQSFYKMSLEGAISRHLVLSKYLSEINWSRGSHSTEWPFESIER